MRNRMDTRVAAALVVAGLLGGCSVPSQSADDGFAPKQQAGQSEGVDRRPAAGTLAELLVVLGGEAGTSWKSYDQIRAVQWKDSAPKEYSDGHFARTGVIELRGYSSKSVPDGNLGAEAGVVQANEGMSGVTLDGSSSAVESISVRKFYAESDYANALRVQFGDRVSVSGITQQCESDEDESTAGNAFYRIGFGNGRAVYAEAYVEDGGQSGPGYTVFDFYRGEPRSRMQALHCK